MDEPLAIEKNGQTYYYHADALGSIVALSGQSGALVQAYGYDSFGNLKNWPTAVIQPYMYTGREYDPEKGTYHYRARDYDPKAGRFLQKDPIGFKAGDENLYRYVDSVGKPPRLDTNLYRYTQNDPVNYIDPTGLYGVNPDYNSWQSNWTIPDLSNIRDCSYCDSFLNACYPTSGAVGTGTGFLCKTLCVAGTRGKMGTACQVICSGVGAGIGQTLSLQCAKAYRACKKDCEKNNGCEK